MIASNLVFSSALVPIVYAVRIVCIGRLISSVEYLAARRQFHLGGMLNYEPLRKLRHKARTDLGKGVESALEAAFLRYAGPLFALDAVLSVALEIRPNLWPVVLASAAAQYLIMRRDVFSNEGADQMTLIVLLACGLGEISTGAGALAAVSFLAATAVLAYFVSAFYKASSRPWVTGEALVTIVSTTTYGHQALRRPMLRHPRLGAVASFVVLLWESSFGISVISPWVILLVLLLIGAGFHLMCGLVMGLNHFLWAFVATYPAVIYLNGLVDERQVAPWGTALGVLWTALLLVCWNSRPYSKPAQPDPARRGG